MTAPPETPQEHVWPMFLLRREDPPVHKPASRICHIGPPRDFYAHTYPLDHASRWRYVAEELKARPDEWWVVAEGSNLNTLGTMENRIKCGDARWWQPEGSYDAKIRTVDGLTVLYAKYLGT